MNMLARAELSRDITHSIALAKAREIKAEHTPKLDDFTDKYDPAAIALDKETENFAELQRAKTEEDPTKRKFLEISDIIEAMIFEQIELSDWLGSSASTSLATRYDDYTNGMDMVVRIDTEEPEPIFIGIDITFSGNLSKKMNMQTRAIISNKLGTVKYHDDIDPKYRGKLEKIPQVIIKLNEKRIEELTELWQTDKKKMARHNTQMLIVMELYDQLRSYEAYSYHLHKEKAPQSLERTLNYFEKLLKQKQADYSPEELEGLNHDPAYEELVRHLREMDRLSITRG